MVILLPLSLVISCTTSPHCVPPLHFNPFGFQLPSLAQPRAPACDPPLFAFKGACNDAEWPCQQLHCKGWGVPKASANGAFVALTKSKKKYRCGLPGL